MTKPNNSETENAGDDVGFDLQPVVEALIFAAEESISEKQIVEIVNDTIGVDATPAMIARAVEGLNDDYAANGRAFRVHVWSGGYRMATQPDFAPFVKTLYYQQKVTRLSRSLLETLSILAYRQPATKPELDYIRGVDCDHAIRKLLELGLVEIAGRADSVGRPLLYTTTAEFMDKFGLSSLEDLPTLRELEELMNDPAYNKEHAQLLFREGLGLETSGGDEPTELTSRQDSSEAESPDNVAPEGADSNAAGPLATEVEGDGAVGTSETVQLGSGEPENDNPNPADGDNADPTRSDD